ncbi:MAG: SGNH/GDSL hydrolase family protein [Verrucomicrobiota bacterium]
MKKKIGISILSLLLILTLLFVWNSRTGTISALLFDALIYGKSTTYGYFPPGKPYAPKNYGTRAADITALKQTMNAMTNTPLAEIPSAKWLKNEAEGKYVVAVIGDSFVWGQGIRNEDRFVQLLSTRLNRIRPTRILSFGNCGDNIMEYFQKYEAAREILPDIDLVVFGLCHNDLLVNPPPARYGAKRLKEILDLCPDRPFLEDPIWQGGRNAKNSPRHIQVRTLPAQGIQA